MGGDKPPTLKEPKDGKQGSNYLQWRREALIWQLGTNVANVKQAPRVVMCLEGKVRDFASRIAHNHLGAENGLEYLIGQLDEYYKEDEAQTIFLAIDQLENFIRDESQSMVEYISEFSRRNDHIAELLGKDAYHDGVLAYRLLRQSSLTPEDQKLVKATLKEISFASMCTSLKKTFGDAVILSEQKSLGSKTPLPISVFKQEPTEVYHSDYYRGGYNRGNKDSYRRNGSGENLYSQSGHSSFQPNVYNQHGKRFQNRDNFRRDENKDGVSKKNSINPRTGEEYQCRVCKSIYHFQLDCPIKDRQ